MSFFLDRITSPGMLDYYTAFYGGDWPTDTYQADIALLAWLLAEALNGSP